MKQYVIYVQTNDTNNELKNGYVKGTTWHYATIVDIVSDFKKAIMFPSVTAAEAYAVNLQSKFPDTYYYEIFELDEQNNLKSVS